ncbi:MAG TPA: DUF6799 domain-containing protein [Opitutaceae bacterium]|nr:DUF6799 domain-containing protein [Opitutaceae bacterium]
MALSLAAIFCLGSSVMAGPEPMYVMINGKMMKVVPMTKDVTLKNGCKVCTVGVWTDAKGNTVMLKNGDVISTDGKLMKPQSSKSHGG